MSSEFRIDRPGVYKMRNGRRVYVWPLLSTSSWWSGEDGNSSACAASELYRDDGRLLPNRDTQFDIVEYIDRLPDDMLARMRRALALAEGDEPQSPTVEQRLRHKCSVCGEWPNERGVLHHGRGCYVTDKGGGGCTYVDFEKEPKQ